MEKTTPFIEMELYIVRHGQSCTNVKGGYGIPDEELTRDQWVNPPLTDLGKRQATLLGEFYRDVKFDAVYASPLRRATQTAYYALMQNECSEKKIYTLPWLIECGIETDYSAVTFEELSNEFPDTILAPDGIDVSGHLVTGDGHDDEANRIRAEKTIRYLREHYKNGEKVMLVAHAAFNTDLFFESIYSGKVRTFDPDFHNTSVTKLIYYKEGTGRFGFDVELSYLNSTAHLAKNERST